LSGLFWKKEWCGIEEVKRQGKVLGDGSNKPFTEQERKLVEILRQLDYGEVRIIVKAGVPVHIEEIKKSIKL